MIPEPNLWADLRDRDRGLEEVEYPPHHLEAVAPNNMRTLPRGGNCEHFLKEELELDQPGVSNGSASAVTMSSAASMNNVNEAEVMRQRQRWTRRWYLLVIVLLYIGLLASFSLNVSLLLRKPSSAPVIRTGTPENTAVSAVSVTDLENGLDKELQGRTFFYNS